MQVVQRLISVIAAVALSICYIGLGLGACLLPPVTTVLSSSFAKDDISPFDRTQLVKVADATRDYSFGSHDEVSLYQAILEVDREYQHKVESAQGKVDASFPDIDEVVDPDDLVQLEKAFANSSELYCYSPDTVSHLDDCHAIIEMAVPLLTLSAAAGIAGLVACGFLGKKRRVGSVLLASGAAVLVAFALLGIWAAVDFAGFFASFHHLFFSQGNWTFPYDSLLICALPEPFWAGMGALWLGVTAIISVAAIVAGRKLR